MSTSRSVRPIKLLEKTRMVVVPKTPWHHLNGRVAPTQIMTFRNFENAIPSYLWNGGNVLWNVRYWFDLAGLNSRTFCSRPLFWSCSSPSPSLEFYWKNSRTKLINTRRYSVGSFFFQSKDPAQNYAIKSCKCQTTRQNSFSPPLPVLKSLR